MTDTTIKGIHHITAVSGSAPENFHFYTQVLGLKLVKKTVNYDDPGTYHLYYGDETGQPGTLLTFFPYPGGPRVAGTGQATRIRYSVGRGGRGHWSAALERAGVETFEEVRFGETLLVLRDPHGIELELREDAQRPDHRLGSFQGLVLTLERAEQTGQLLQKLGFRLGAEEPGWKRYELPGKPDQIDLRVDPKAPRGRGGPGTIHHIALRVPDRQHQLQWQARLRDEGYHVSPVRDRNYFHSIYFRGPGGVLFELATDPPGMTIDETPEELGRKLMLPPQYEKHRAALEEHLPPLEPAAKGA